jgi:hypothetical protein
VIPLHVLWTKNRNEEKESNVAFNIYDAEKVQSPRSGDTVYASSMDMRAPIFMLVNITIFSGRRSR